MSGKWLEPYVYRRAKEAHGHLHERCFCAFRGLPRCYPASRGVCTPFNNNGELLPTHQIHALYD